VCHCKSVRYQPADDSVPTRLCGICHKGVPDGQRHGSLTQWIFRFDSCKCDQPQPVSLSDVTRVSGSGLRGASQSKTLERSKRKSGTTNENDDVKFVADETVADENVPAAPEKELPVSAQQFPLERYSPLAVLGQGADGIVYLAKDRLLNKKVGVKILNNLTGDQLIAFQNEAKLTSKLEHPNIIQVLNFGPTPSGVPYMVLEYSDRVLSLSHSILENGPLDVSIAVEVFLKIADALQFAHEMKIYHRDLKPSNILFTYTDHQDIKVKLIDFGVASVKRECLEPTMSDHTTIVGTLGYMAPELASGTQFNARCEIYSLGCVLFEALTGRLPFTAESPIKMLSLHTGTKAPSLNAVAGVHFSDQIEQLVSDCLSKDPEARPASAAVFKDRLQKILVTIRSADASDLSERMNGSINEQSIHQGAIGNHSSVKENRLFNKTWTIYAIAALTILSGGFFILRNMLENEKTATNLGKDKTDPAPSTTKSASGSRKLADQLYGTELLLENAKVSDISIENAADITSIKLKHCTITQPDALLRVASFPKLKNLSFNNTTGLNETAMKRLVQGLKKIATNKTAFKAKNRLEKPLFFDFSFSDVDYDGLKLLQEVPSVAALSLAGLKVDDTIIDIITPHKMLQAIDISLTRITDKGAKKLVAMKSLILLRAFNVPGLDWIKTAAVFNHTTVVVQESETDIDDEFPICFEAAQQNNPRAQAHLASLYYSGAGVTRDFDEALKWYKKAALAGNTGAQISVGTFYRLGLVGKKPSYDEALKWYQMAYANGSRDKSALQIAALYERGFNGKPDYGNAKKYYKIAAELGSATASMRLGEIAYSGLDGKENVSEAMKWYHKGAKSGSGFCMYSIGACYLDGKGVKQSDKQAFNYFTRAAQVGDEAGMYGLGCLYMDGRGTAVDPQAALRWLRQASDKGLSDATAKIGTIYEKGLGVKQDYAEAVRWYKRAAFKSDNSDAYVALGDLYREGRGVKTDIALAESYYKSASALGNEEARQRLRR